MPDFSGYPCRIRVMIPVFNHTDYISNAIESVLNQTDAIVELDILDDGSTEDILNQISSFLSHENVTFTKRKNKGLPISLNELTSSALSSPSSPPFLSWHSADNLYYPEALGTMVNFLLNNPDIGFCYANIQLIDVNGRPLYNSGYRTSDTCTDDKSCRNLDYPCNTLMSYNDNFVGACFLMRRGVEKLLPGYDKDALGYEDYKHWIQTMFVAPGSHIKTSAPLYKYRLHQESLSETLEMKDVRASQVEYLEKSLKAFSQLEVVNDLQVEIFSSSSSESSLKLTLSEALEVVQKNCGGTSCSILRLRSNDPEYKSPKNALDIISSPPPLHQSFTDLMDYHSYFILPHAHKGLDQDLNPNLLELRSTCLPVANAPDWFCRARNRDLGFFSHESERFRSKAAIFMPSNPYGSDAIIKSVSNVIIENSDTVFILLCSSQLEREFADSIFLDSKGANNVRIADSRQDHFNDTNQARHLQNQTYLNALGSVDIVLSISCFTTHEVESPVSVEGIKKSGLLDIYPEAVMAALTGRFLAVPIQGLSHPILDLPPMPHATVWNREQKISQFCMQSLKARREEFNSEPEFQASIDAVLRAFSNATQYRKIGGCLIAYSL